VYFPLGGPNCAELEHALVEQIRGQLIERGLVTGSAKTENPHLELHGCNQRDTSGQTTPSGPSLRGDGHRRGGTRLNRHDVDTRV